MQFDPAKPPEERTLPGGFLERFAGGDLFVVVDNAVFPAPCFLVVTQLMFDAGSVAEPGDSSSRKNTRIGTASVRTVMRVTLKP